jgi:hypothetical protein
MFQMTHFIGVKEILAVPMNRADYNNYRGWDLPDGEDPNDLGYLVEYLDGGQANHPDHKGYISWSPLKVFENAYRPTTGLSFGLALEALKRGKKIAREGWNGKGMWLMYVPGRDFVQPTPGTPYQQAGLNRPITIGSHIDMFTAQGIMQPGWLASQADMLADDWVIVNE